MTAIGQSSVLDCLVAVATASASAAGSRVRQPGSSHVQQIPTTGEL